MMITRVSMKAVLAAFPAAPLAALVALALGATLLPAVAHAGRMNSHHTHAAMHRASAGNAYDRYRSRHRRAATRLHVDRGDAWYFQPWAPPVPPFFPFGFDRGYF